jgi:hypothetical protein
MIPKEDPGNLGFSKIISAIEAEIKTEYLPGAINWADTKLNGAWSAAMNRFDDALTEAIKRKDYTLAKIEGDFYKRTILDLLSQYKKAKHIDDSSSFLDQLKTGTGGKR